MVAGNFSIRGDLLIEGNAALTSAGDELSKGNTVCTEGGAVTGDADMVTGGNGWAGESLVRSGKSLLAVGALAMLLFVVGVSAAGFDNAF